MILSRPDILERLKSDLKITPAIDLDQVAQVSIDLRLGRKFTTFKTLPGYVSTFKMDPSIWAASDIWNHSEADTFDLGPGKFVLAQTQERICMPPDLVGLVEGRSSWARLGITVHVTAPKIDPGFDAPITLEMANFGPLTITLRSGIDKPAQLMLLRISTPLAENELYGTGKNDTFQHQTDPIPRLPSP